MSDALIARLEALAIRLETVATSLGGAGAIPPAAASAGEVARQVTAYDDFFKAHVQPFLDAANKFNETKEIGQWAEKAFKFSRTVIEASTKCKKPSDADYVKFLDPIIQVVSQASNKADNRSPFYAQQKAFGEAIGCMSWLMSPMPKQIVQDQLESADFYLIKVLNEGKKKGGQEGQDVASFAATLKTALQKLVEYVSDYYKTGLEWNFKGGDLSSFNASSAAPAAPAAPPAPPAAPAAPAAPPAPAPPAPGAPAAAPAAKTAGGMDAVFSQLRAGSDITSGLKKVTSDMKTKNMKDVPALTPQGKPTTATPSPSATPKVAEKKPARLYESKGTWFCENFENETVTVTDVKLKENVYIMKCKNSVIHVNDKCKSIQLDSCQKVQIVFKNIVSIFECFNSQRITIICTESFPSISIDKSSGVIVVLNEEGVKNPPTIITSCISECNVQVPGQTPEDDPIEIPIPEQFQTNLVGGKLKTEPVSHSSN